MLAASKASTAPSSKIVLPRESSSRSVPPKIRFLDQIDAWLIKLAPESTRGLVPSVILSSSVPRYASRGYQRTGIPGSAFENPGMDAFPIHLTVKLERSIAWL